MKVTEVSNAILVLDTEVSSNIRKAKSRSELDFSYSLDPLYERAVGGKKDEESFTPVNDADGTDTEGIDAESDTDSGIDTESQPTDNTEKDS